MITKRGIKGTYGIGIAIISFLILGMQIKLPAAEKNQLYAGFSKVKITPEIPIPMSGYGGRTEPFKGVHDDLYLRVIVMSAGDEKAALITADLIGFSHRLSDEIKVKITQITGIAGDHILLAATHTHGGPTTGSYEAISDSVQTFINQLKVKITGAVQEADSRLRPVRIGAGKGECLMNINRRARTAEGSIELGRNPYKPCDHEVAVIRFDELVGETVSLFINWPCHGTVLGPKNYLITGDWPGAAALFVEKKYDNKLIAPVTGGASGDINPIYGPHIDFVDNNAYAYGMEAIGAIVGEEVLRIANNTTTYAKGAIESLQKIVMLPGKKRGTSNAAPERLEPAEPVEVRLSALKIGNIVLAGISGEVMNEIGMQIKKLSPYTQTCVVTHCNGGSGYLATDASFKEGGYEVRTTRAMPGAEKILVETMLEMINQLE